MQFICQIGDSWMQITCIFFPFQIGYFRMHIVNVHFLCIVVILCIQMCMYCGPNAYAYV